MYLRYMRYNHYNNKRYLTKNERSYLPSALLHPQYFHHQWWRASPACVWTHRSRDTLSYRSWRSTGYRTPSSPCRAHTPMTSEMSKIKYYFIKRRLTGFIFIMLQAIIMLFGLFIFVQCTKHLIVKIAYLSSSTNSCSNVKNSL